LSGKDELPEVQPIEKTTRKIETTETLKTGERMQQLNYIQSGSGAPVVIVENGTGSKAQAIDNDDDYLKACFEICSRIAYKEELLGRMGETTPNGDPFHVHRRRMPESTDAGKNDLRAKMQMVNREIYDRSTYFKASVERSGKRFSFEELAASLGLDAYEKMIVMYFIYLESMPGKDVRRSLRQLMLIFDLGDSVRNRIASAAYFDEKRTLLSKKVLIPVRDMFSRFESNVMRLNPEIIVSFSGILNGETICQADLLQKMHCEGESDSVSDVGFVKDPEYGMDDVITAETVKDEIRMVLDAINNPDFQETGIASHIRKGIGSTFLFYGPPGTGKSMMAEAVAAHLGKKVLFVAIQKITSMWHGETEKNISAIFRCASKDDLVIVMDEADSLLYGRESAARSHEVRIVNVMLQELERFNGVIVLTTNLETVCDPALERRITLKVRFEPPDMGMWVRIWKTLLPIKMMMDESVDLDFLAGEFDFSGGNIKNAVLHAVRRAVSMRRSVMTMEDLIFGATLEHKGMYTRKSKKPPIGFSKP